MFESKHKLRMKIIDLELKIESLKIDRDWAEKREREAERKLNERRAQETEKARNASIYVDWDNIQLISIERRVNDWGVSLTEVDYWGEVVENGVAVKKHKSMIFYCCDEIHENLVADYERWKDEKEFKR